MFYQLFYISESLYYVFACVQEHLVKDSLALDFLLEVFVTWKKEKGLASLMTALKRGGIESRLMEFVPLNKRTEEHFRATFEEKGLADIVKLHKAQVKPYRITASFLSESTTTFLANYQDYVKVK